MERINISFASDVLLFAVYAFGGWTLETVYASIRKRSFVNRGFLFGCFCPVYGFGALLIIHVTEWTGARIDDPFIRSLALVCVSAFLITGLEYITGMLLDKVFERRWWDYSGNRWNLGGYVCVEFSLLWGGIAYILAEVLHPAVSRGLDLLPAGLSVAMAWGVVSYFAVDIAASARREWHVKSSAIRQSGTLTDMAEYSTFIADLLGHEQVQRMDSFIQHGRTTCLKHSETVSYLSYKLCRKWKLDFRSAARGGLLHDLFLYDWHKPDPEKKWHAFAHPQVALRNAQSYFSLNEIEEDIIAKHMWPLTPFLPRYKESWVVCMIDKYVTVCEILDGGANRLKNRKERRKKLQKETA